MHSCILLDAGQEISQCALKLGVFGGGQTVDDLLDNYVCPQGCRLLKRNKNKDTESLHKKELADSKQKVI